MKKTLFTLIISLIASSSFAQWNQNGSNSTSGNLSIGNYQKDNGELTIKSGNPQISRSYLNFDFGKSKSGLRSAKLEDMSTTLAFYTSNPDGTLLDRIYIKGNGNVGIGTENPQHKLDVNGDIRTKNLVIAWNNRLGTSLTDNFQYNNRAMGHYTLGWMDDDKGAALWQSGYSGIKFFTRGQYRMGINFEGNVGIGTENPKNKLDVNGTIRAKEVKVELENWSDFVFDKDYKLPSLAEVEAHINEHKHLPDIPSEKQVKEEGLNLAEMQAKLLQKIEELTLYVIKQEKEIEKLKVALSEK